MASGKTIDWPRIEFEYCDGEDSIREIADRYDVSEGAIRKRAKAAGWSRPVRTPKKRVLVRTDPASPPPPPSDPTTPVDAVQITDAGRNLVWRMLDELDTATSRRGELEDMIAAATVDDEDDARQEAMQRAVSLPARANTLKTLALGLKALNESAAPQGKKQQAQDKADAVANRFRGVGPPTLTAVK